MAENMEILDKLIIGRVEPHIYAFSAEEIPGYLKVGDTYRPVSVRLEEWKRHFPTLKEEYREKAVINDEIFFRDYAVHQYLEEDLGKKRLQAEDVEGTAYSREFFKDTAVAEVAEAIEDIKEKFEKRIQKYQYYSTKKRLPETYTYASTGEWALRPNQQKTVDNFMKAIEGGRTNLLMYAVMRFGKSFTSLCCAKRMGAKIVLVVSAKADVCGEWQKTVQQADNFNKDYSFLTSAGLTGCKGIIKSTLDSGKGIVVFLTLQDLQGEHIKEKHQEIFENTIDLLIVDETHYGARAKKYGQIIRDSNYVKDVVEKYADDDYIDYEIADEHLKVLESRVRLHLSGTPYRILMGSEFCKEDIVAFYQFTDIVADQKKWDMDHMLSDKVKEWDNPYYGFPQMVRFAFKPSKAAQARLEMLKSGGNTYAFSALFKPKSLKKAADGSHREFVYEQEVLDLFKAIDGSKEDEELFGFLDYDRIKKGNMCRHMVCVLPYCAACDALETLFMNNRETFKNLQDYTIINISGVDKPNMCKSVEAVKRKITNCEKKGEKTITLTVNRMLTGSTVEQWDTMLFLKDTASPQEYDQAIYRLQNQYIKTYTDESGEIIKFNMKPQTLLVDFDPHRMFIMQEQKSLVYNMNVEEGGNQKLEERIREELRISPIITMNKNKISQVECTDILNEVSAYSRNRSVIDEAREIPVDLSLCNIEIIKSAIERQAELGSGKGFETEAYGGEDADLTTDTDETNQKDQQEDGERGNSPGINGEEKEDDTERQKLENKFRMYYSRILFFAFLSDSVLRSIDDILDIFDNENNRRIARNLLLEKNVLKSIKQNINPFILSQLDYKIQNMNILSHDKEIEPSKRAAWAINKFGKLSESEVPTPPEAAKDMVALLPKESFLRLQHENTAILDIASKIGEFAIAVCERAGEVGVCTDEITSSVLSIPTSSVAYEFTRKIYAMMGLDTECIAKKFTSYDLLTVKTADREGKLSDGLDYEKISQILKQKKKLCDVSLTDQTEKGEEMKFEAIVGNPPYQISDGGAQASAKPIYHNFVEMSKALSPKRITMITPSRWYAGGKGLDTFRNQMLGDEHIEELDDFLHPEELFPDTNNRGGICYFLWNAEYDNRISQVKVVSHIGNGLKKCSYRSLRTGDLDIFVRDNTGVEILNKIMCREEPVMAEYISPRRPFGLDGNFIKSNAFFSSDQELKNPVQCFGKARSKGYVERECIKVHKEWIDRWKVLMPYANNIGTELNDDNQNTFVAEPGTVCTETFLVAGIGLTPDKESAWNLAVYLKTHFARFLLSLAKISQHGTAKTYRFIPVQDFFEGSDINWKRNIRDIDSQLYRKYGLTQEEIQYIESKIKPMV